MKAPLTVLLVGALPSSLVNFRGPLIKAMQERGLRVVATANGHDPATEAQLGEWGVVYAPIHIERAGMNPLGDLRTLVELIRLMRRVRPDIVLAYTIKPVVYGGLAARFCRVPAIYSMVEGLGRAFMPRESLSHGISSALAKLLYRVGLPGSNRVFFLNPDDRHHFVDAAYVPAQKSVLLNGIGIDLAYYPAALTPTRSEVQFLMIARLLRDKGVREYVSAARHVRAQHPGAQFVLAGDLDDNPSSIQKAELESWLKERLVDYLGYLGDVRPSIRECQVYVLPSYREGTPRTVLEAMAMGRAIITTDTPGCRETVRKPHAGDERNGDGAWIQHGRLKIGTNGILVAAKDADALAEAMGYCIDHPEQIAIMGRESRRYAEDRYDVRKVNQSILAAMGLETPP